MRALPGPGAGRIAAMLTYVLQPTVCSGTCAKLFKSEVQFGHAGAKSGGDDESAQVRTGVPVLIKRCRTPAPTAIPCRCVSAGADLVVLLGPDSAVLHACQERSGDA